MFNISKYLEKVVKQIDSKDLLKSKISHIIKISTNLDIEIEKIEVKEGVAYLKTNQAYLNKIFISKSRILKEVPEILDIK